MLLEPAGESAHCPCGVQSEAPQRFLVQSPRELGMGLADLEERVQIGEVPFVGQSPGRPCVGLQDEGPSSPGIGTV